MNLQDILAKPKLTYNENSIFEANDDIEVSSYTNEGYIFLEEMYHDFNTYKRQLYVSIAESEGQQDVITESFSGFFTKIKDLIVKFIEFIKRLFNKFLLNMNRLVKSEKYIKNHKEDLYEFSKENEFDFTGYKYSIVDNIPVISIVEDLSTDFVKVGNITLTTDDKSVSEKLKEINDELTKSLKLDYYDIIRGKVVGNTDGTKIKASNYANKLFKLYRSNRDSKDEYRITSSIVTDIYRAFSNYKDKLEIAKETKTNIEDNYEELKNKLDAMYDIKSSGNAQQTINFLYNTTNGNDLSGTATLSVEDLNSLDTYFKKLSDVIMSISAIHTNAFTAKLDALKEEFNQSKLILYKALSEIYKTKGKE